MHSYPRQVFPAQRELREALGSLAEMWFSGDSYDKTYVILLKNSLVRVVPNSCALLTLLPW